jgi:glyoxylase-like metal-dependent hydrolase (beta-lactamase superfamily II)
LSRSPEPAPGHPEIVRVVADNPGPMTLEGTNTYVVTGEPATGVTEVFVIDPGPADPDHIDAVRRACADRGELAGALLTHSHGDHADGVASLGAPLLTPADASRAGLNAIATPGHTQDHVCFARDRICFTGDLVLGEGSTIVPPDGGSLFAYLDSLRKLQDLELELLCPGHGPWVTDPSAKLTEYVEHRLDRERKLVAALDAGERSRARLLDAAWDDVPAGLRPAAAMAMEAHLQKLAAEDRLPDGIGE